MFTCVLCRVLFYEPMTIGCGHTFCRKCLERDRSKNGGGITCKDCGTMHYGLNPANIRTNVVLSNLIKKWFPDRSRAAELRTEGNKYFEKKDFQRAVTLYSEAISFYEADHLLFSNRSHAYAALQQYDRALEDAEKVVVLHPKWPKGFFRKGNALYELARYEEAAMAFLQCLALDRDSTLAEENLSKSLHMIVSKPAPEDPESTDWPRQQDATKFQALINGSLDIGALQSHLSTHTWGQLTQLMDDLMTNESASSASLTSSHVTSSSGEAGDSGSNSTGMETNSADVISDIEKNYQRSEADFEAAEPQKIDPDLLNVEDLECSLCYRLFYQPVTTPCGHTFCRQCLDRCLDHQTSCPMCKSSLAEFLAERRSAVTQCLQAVIVTYFQEDHVIRQQIHEEEMKELARMGLDRQHDIPIFVCTLGFPTVLCPLHIFEPRYRLMVRQCMESGSRQFGMCTCVGNTEEEFTEYGCMLEVRDVHYFPDGRSLVDTVGGRRFRVLSRGKRDGYNTAKVEFLQDDPISDNELADIQSEQEEVYRSLESWLASLPLFHRARISQHFGNLPDPEMNLAASPNGPAWAWWSIAVLPLDPEVQLDLLASCSYKERLKVVKQVLGHLNSRFQ